MREFSAGVLEKFYIFIGVVVTKSQTTHLKPVHFTECKLYASFFFKYYLSRGS